MINCILTFSGSKKPVYGTFRSLYHIAAQKGRDCRITSPDGIELYSRVVESAQIIPAFLRRQAS